MPSHVENLIDMWPLRSTVLCIVGLSQMKKGPMWFLFVCFLKPFLGVGKKERKTTPMLFVARRHSSPL